MDDAAIKFHVMGNGASCSAGKTSYDGCNSQSITPLGNILALGIFISVVYLSPVTLSCTYTLILFR